MNVLIITGIFPPDIGGPATSVPQVATGLVQRGHRVTVLTLSERLDHDDGSYPFRVVRLPRRIWRLRRQVKTILQILRLSRQAGVLFVNGLALEAALANYLLRKPLLLKVVGDLAWERAVAYGWVKESFEEFQQKRYGLRVGLLRRLRTWWTQRADAVIVPSRYLARWVARWGVPEDRLAVIYNAVEIADGVQPAPLPLKTAFNAVTVGRLVPWKRIDQILEAIAQIDGLGLVVVGDGPERGRLEDIASDLGIQDRVYFAGQRDRTETMALMAPCDFFVLNSAYEGLPHVVLEAMGLGLPVVATAAGGTPEVVEDGVNGLLVPVEDQERLKEAILRVLQDKKLAGEFVERSRERLEQVFSWNVLMKRTLEVLQAIAR